MSHSRSLFSKVSKLLSSPICGTGHTHVPADVVYIKQEFQNAFSLLRAEFDSDTKKCQSVMTVTDVNGTVKDVVSRQETAILSTESSEMDIFQ